MVGGPLDRARRRTRRDRRRRASCGETVGTVRLSLVVDNIGLLVTNDPELGDGARRRARDRGRRRSAAVERAGAQGDERIDAAGRCVIPGFVDSHTHLVFAGDRGDEFAARMAGAPYAAGGIRVTTDATRAAVRRRAGGADARAARRGAARRHHAPRDQVRLRPRRRDRASGCARSPARVHRRRDVPRRPRRARPSTRAAPTTTSSSSAARCSPPARRTRRWIDVFCEAGRVRRRPVGRRSSHAGAIAGLGLRVHGNQLGPGPGVQLAVELGAASVDHCTYLERRGHRGARRRATRSRRSCRRPTSRPASRTPTRAARSTRARRSRSRPTATPARATRPRWRSASRSPCATCT